MFFAQGKMCGKNDPISEEIYLQKAYDGAQRRLGPRHYTTLQTANLLGNCYMDRMDKKGAKKLFSFAYKGEYVTSV